MDIKTNPLKLNPLPSVPFEVNGYPVIASALVEVQSDGARCFIILVEKSNEFVTAWYRLGDREWNHGTYITWTRQPKAAARREAFKDFYERAAEHY